jgi:TonB family protein
MRHADDGTLSALLDGALATEEGGALRDHLLLCADCRRRLEHARTLRDQADALLASGLPAFAPPPPFEELARRAAAGTTAGSARPGPQPWRTWRPRLRSLAWAATVVLALAGGWWGRAFLQPARNGLTESGRMAGVIAPPHGAVPATAGGAAATVGAAARAPVAGVAAPSGSVPANPSAAAPGAAGAGPPAHAPAVAQAAAPSAAAGFAAVGGRLTSEAPAVVTPLGEGKLAAGSGAARAAEVSDVASRAPAVRREAASRPVPAAVPAPMPASELPPPADLPVSAYGDAAKAMQDKALAGGAARTLVTAQSVEAAPTFTPYTVAPVLRNREDVRQALLRAYPEELKGTGLGGTTLLWILLDENGTIMRSQVKQSSGSLALDRAAFQVAAIMRFSPALNRDKPVKVWVSIPVVFAPTP